MARNWTCPHCGQPQPLLGEAHSGNPHPCPFPIEGHEDTVFYSMFYRCANDDCGKVTLRCSLDDPSASVPVTMPVGVLSAALIPPFRSREWRLLPPSDAKPLPSYVPAQVRQDYEEACLIRDLSPRASATLARRALQGMIRDFWGIAKGTLHKEILALENKVDPGTFEAMKGLKSVGNIGAHPEEDVSCVIEVEPGEAEELVGLIEVFVGEWYTARHGSERAKKRVIALGQKKAAEKKAAKPKAAGSSGSPSSTP